MLVLIWNIQVFTLGKIDNAADPKAQERRDFILSTVRAADPDVFVVVEPHADPGGIATLATGSGPNGLAALRGFLNQPNQPWRLVPPLRVNERVLDKKTHTETVGVFWRSDRVAFEGPRQLPANVSYPPPWNLLSDNSRYIAEVPLSDADRTAAQQVGGVSYRQPFITDFVKAGRRIRLVSVHLPPPRNNSGSNQLAAEQLSRIAHYEVVGAGDPNVVLIAGDMNLNIGTKGNGAQNGYVRSMAADLGDNYPEGTLLIPYPRTPQPAWPARFAVAPDTDASSMLINVNEARLNNYLGGNLYDYGLAFYRKDNPYPRRHTYPAVAADPVRGVMAVGGAGNPLRTFASAMRENPVTEANFGNDPNYKHVRGTSDHMPVLIEV